ncbi:hypothetical protein HF289_10580 [Acidithiobacillus ferrooxidans]|jgi:hypothetical protein|uniref:hypothetical protein n=1 Tax=Acidithiobacillus ferrooxidans TaxID=920 RepID=UPI000A71A237|nr:hypothetical protein [Acidithiobacillus ferrooxidans]MBU2857293.1 hypothetical protein [Acidithiobacillus ferrooxidans]MBU2861576.1 hypothetical protein [Acidithiobacillus ferrooxidans]MCL4526645.1 hypothetical protein [Gammaproteobacteria bacterium]MCR2832159.1 hypothetical protein [Acidithiobacillus ferrooxidans]
MRTTLDIEDDVLDAARELARREHISAGAAVSRLLRVAFTGHFPISTTPPENTVNGFRPIPADNRLVTDSLIDRLRDESGL